MKSILVATDGSPYSAEAVTFGVELAADTDAEVIFVHVVPAVDVVPVAMFGMGSAFPHEPSSEDRELLDDAAAVAAEHGVVCTTALLKGDTVDEIVAFADSHDVDLIVVGIARPWRARPPAPCSGASRAASCARRSGPSRSLATAPRLPSRSVSGSDSSGSLARSRGRARGPTRKIRSSPDRPHGLLRM